MNNPTDPRAEPAQDETKPKRTIRIGSQRDLETDSDAKPAPRHSMAAHSDVLESPMETHSADDPPADDQATPSVSEKASKSFPPPRIDTLPDDVQAEVDAALAGISLNDLMDSGAAAGGQAIEQGTRMRAQVFKVHREDVFCSLPGHKEGVASLRQFEEEPQPGAVLDVIVDRLNPEDGLYELSIPGAAADVGNWDDVEEGLVVEVLVTGHNTGGLECELNKLRGFIPISQISLYRVEDLEPFLNERLKCVITEANPDRRNLVLSHKAFLEREQAAAKEKLIKELAPGQTREGVVRNIRDFGAFVDLGGIDGLVHVSKLSWDRVNHPSEVLEEGQRIKVKVEKIDEVTGKISLSFRDTLEQPWEKAEQKFPAGSLAIGTISKIMDFGAFVRLEAGIEGLVHISELAHHRVTRVDSVVAEGQEVEVKVLSIDSSNQKMSLSIKQATVAPVKANAKREEETAEEPLRERAVKSHEGPLKGGTNRPTGGEQFGLNW